MSAAPARWARRQGRLGYAMVAPSVLGLALFQLTPLLWAAAESTQHFNPITHQSLGFVGLENFSTVFEDAQFWQAVVHTVVYGVVITAVEVPVALGIALALHKVVPGTRFARAAVISALAASESVAALLWFTILNQNTGLVNSFLGVLGVPHVPWLTSSPLALISVVVMSVWKDIGLPVLVYLAGLQALDDDLYSAASLDGASAWQQFRYLTVPLLRRSTLITVFMVTIAATRIFTPIVIMTTGGPNGSSQNLTYYAYAQGFRHLDYGVGSAATVCMIVLLAVVTAGQGLLLREKK